MAANVPRILLSEGSSLSAREAVTALGLAGHRVDLVSSDPMCLARFSRFVSHVHPVPACGGDPDGYLAAVLDVVARRSIDVLMPVHEQAYLFAAATRSIAADACGRPGRFHRIRASAKQGGFGHAAGTAADTAADDAGRAVGAGFCRRAALPVFREDQFRDGECRCVAC